MGKDAKADHYEEARAMFLLGHKLKDIAVALGITERQVARWRSEHEWIKQKESMLENPRHIGEMLREVLRNKVNKILVEREMTSEEVDEIAKLTTLIEKIEGSGYQFMAACIEVLKHFATFVKQRDTENIDYEPISRNIKEFLLHIIKES